MREKIRSMRLTTWFHPTVDVQRNENSDLYAFDGQQKLDVILPGDLLHCDIGINYLTLKTDCQQLAYVLKPDETQAPDYLNEALKEGNKVQDIFTGNFKTGRSGNTTLKLSLDQGKTAGYRPQIYTHPLGIWTRGTILDVDTRRCLALETIRFRLIRLMLLNLTPKFILNLGKKT